MRSLCPCFFWLEHRWVSSRLIGPVHRTTQTSSAGPLAVRTAELAAANGFFSSGQFAWMTIYLPELFPTQVLGTVCPMC